MIELPSTSNFSPLLWGLVVFFGAMLGSFLNVVILRLPEGHSIVFPGSHCPKCKEPIRWYDNIPVLSWMLLRARCRSCGDSISIQYPFVEFLTALWAAVVVACFGLSYLAIIYFLFGASLIVITFIDLHHRIIPNVISIPGILLGWIALPWTYEDPWSGFVSVFFGALAGGGVLLAVALFYELVRKRQGMGMGDVKLLAMIGAFLGLQSIFFVLFVSAMLGSIIGISLAVAGRAGRMTALPFGPYLSAAAILYIFVGPQVVEWYLRGLTSS